MYPAMCGWLENKKYNIMQATVNNNNAFKTIKNKQYVIIEQKLPPIPFNPVKYKAPMLCIQVIAPKVKQLLKELKKTLVFLLNLHQYPKGYPK